MEWISRIGNLKSKYPTIIWGQGDLVLDNQAIQSFLESKPYLSNKLDFLEYLNEVSGISYFNDQTEEDFSIYGFDGNATLSYLGGEFTSFVEEECFLIAHHYFPLKNEIFEFGYRIQNVMDKAIYYNKLTLEREVLESNHRISNSFKEFIDRIIILGLDEYLKKK